MKYLGKDEYIKLKEELNTRVQLMYSHNIGMVTAVFAVWAIAGLFCSEYFKIIQTAISDNAKDFNGILTFGAILLSILFISPLSVLLPFSVRSRDNIGQIESLAGYILVFAEIPTLISKNGKGKNCFYGWEIFQQKAVKERLTLSLFNCEYIILGLIASILFCSTAVLNLCLAYKFHIMYPVLLLHFYIFIFCFAVFAIVLIFSKSNVRSFLKHRMGCIMKYKDIALDQGFVPQEEQESFNKLISMVCGNGN